MYEKLDKVKYKKLLVVPMVGGRGIGPLTRMLSIASEAKKCFKEIRFLCKDSFVETVLHFGFEYYVDVEPIQRSSQGSIKTWNDAAFAMGLCDSEYVERAFSHQLKIVKEFSPDVIVTEYNLVICLVAKVLNIPLVSTISWADCDDFELNGCRFTNDHPESINAYNTILNSNGFSCYRTLSEMITDIPVLVAPTTLRQQPQLQKYGVHYVGELLCKEFELDDSYYIHDDCIYIYMTSCDIAPSAWVNVIKRELAHIDRTVYMVVNQNCEEYIKELPDNFIVAKQLPSCTILKNASLVIHAGSANIISGALIFGVPSLIIPMEDGERMYNAMAVEKNGAGKILDYSLFVKKGGLKSMIDNLISDREAKKKAKELGDEIKALNGPMAVVETLLNETM